MVKVHGAYILGSPPSTVACPYCPRHFKTKGGRNRHIQAKHSGMREPQAPNPSTDPSRTSSSPEPSDFASPPSDSDDDLEPNAYLDIDDHQFNDFDQGSLGGDFDQGSLGGASDSDQGSLGGDSDQGERHVSDVPHIIRIYHPKLDGMLNFFFHIH